MTAALPACQVEELTCCCTGCRSRNTSAMPQKTAITYPVVTIAADIGIRMVATGYVIAVFCGMADVFGFGTQLRPRRPILRTLAGRRCAGG